MAVYTAVPVQPISPWVPGEVMSASAYVLLTTALASGDTVVIPNFFPPSGIDILAVHVWHKPLDSNATPTGAYSFGDNQSDGSAAARYLSGAQMGIGVATGQINNFINVAATFTAGVQTAGMGYHYNTDQASAGTNGGFLNGVLTCTANSATAVGATTIWFKIDYRCSGLI